MDSKAFLFMKKTEIFSWGHNRRFNAYSNYHQKIFSERIQKLSIDAGFTCPNRDGSIALGGCTYCNNDAFNPSYCEVEKSISQQLTEGIEFHENRYRRASKYLAYFQAYSNTYDSLNSLKKRYEEALSFENVIGLVIGTRPDCIDEEKLDYLQKLNETHHIVIEFGIESCYNRTLERINRGHSFEQSVKAIKMAAERNLFTGTHLIFGLPGESRAEMLAEAKIISDLPINSIKLHQLQIIKGTAMEKEFKETPDNFQFFSLEEYIEFVIDFIELLRPDIIIERFAGEVPPRFLVNQGWGKIRNDQILNLIEKRLEERDTWQGKFF